jgi:outer membrane receptor protein involved in Fe transport
MRAAVLALLFAASPLVAQNAPVDPLGKRVTLHVRDVSLRDALDRLAIAAGVRISYSGDNLPLDRRVELARDTTSLGDVLRELLRLYPIDAVAVGGDHVVLTPRARTTPASDSSRREVTLLDRVVVTGSVLGAPERPLPVALDVVAGRDMERKDQTELSQVLDGSVPGVFMWEQAPSSMLARYGSIRGASSFGVSFPKVYIDGIEVANPLLITQISPELIERVEVIRGPQGAALYGSDAISGVINVVSRHEGTGTDGMNVRLKTRAGYANSYKGPAVPVQEHAITLRSGSNLKSAGITLGAATTGEYIPDAYSREFKAIGDARVIGPRTTFTATGRFFDKDAGVPLSPLLPAAKAARFRSDSEPQQLRMYSLGSTITYVPSEEWTTALTAGFDGYSLSNVSSEGSPIPFFVDSALRAAGGAATRGSMRVSAVRRTGDPARLSTTLTFAAEHSMMRERSLMEVSRGPESGFPHYAVEWSGNTGLTAQANVGIRNAVFFTAGLRNEQLGQPHGRSQLATLPMLGAAVVRDWRGATGKLRAAYGRGVRAGRGVFRATSGEPRFRVLNPDLQPEEQSGIEAGADLMFGRRFGVHVTRFDQLAFGLVQSVTLADTLPLGQVRYLHQLQNVGEISNRGWETQASLVVGPMSFGGAASFVNSRVRKLSNSYTGDLRENDRMLAVPARTLSGSATLVQRQFQLTTTLSRASNWVNYDRLAIAECIISGCADYRNLAGQNLRRFWESYPGNTRMRMALSVDLPRGITLLGTGENLLNHQLGEPDSITIVPGRTITLGLRARF